MDCQIIDYQIFSEMLPINRYAYLRGLTDKKLMNICTHSLTRKQEIGKQDKDNHDRLEELLAEIIQEQEDPKLRRLAIEVGERVLKNFIYASDLIMGIQGK